KILDLGGPSCKVIQSVSSLGRRIGKPVNFVIIALSRTGSTHLTNLLNLQDDISCQGEIFHPKKIFLRWPKKDKSTETIAHLTELRQQEPAKFLDRILSQTYGSTHVGFKIFPGHNDDILWHLVESRSIRKIVLLRSNFLASYSSRLIRHQTRGSETAPTDAPTIYFSLEEFLRYCDEAAS